MTRPPGRGAMLTNCPVAQTTRTTAPVRSLSVSLVQTPGAVAGAAGVAGLGATHSPPDFRQMLTLKVPLRVPAAPPKLGARPARRHRIPTIKRRKLRPAGDPAPLRT